MPTKNNSNEKIVFASKPRAANEVLVRHPTTGSRQVDFYSEDSGPELSPGTLPTGLWKVVTHLNRLATRLKYTLRAVAALRMVFCIRSRVVQCNVS